MCVYVCVGVCASERERLSYFVHIKTSIKNNYKKLKRK